MLENVENERKPVSFMTDRELAEETLTLLRAGADAIQSTVNQMQSGNGGMMGMLMGMMRGK